MEIKSSIVSGICCLQFIVIFICLVQTVQPVILLYIEFHLRLVSWAYNVNYPP